VEEVKGIATEALRNKDIEAKNGPTFAKSAQDGPPSRSVADYWPELCLEFTWARHAVPLHQGARGLVCLGWRETLLVDGAEEIGDEAVAGGFDAGIVFDEAEAEDVHVEADGAAAAFEVGERIGG
jgi:hypothetical protein